MKVEFVGFGGVFGTPVYEDENGRLYFDENHGRDGLNLYTGVWKDKTCGEFCGEPNVRVTEEVECDVPYVKHPRAYDYQLLNRLRMDCDHYIKCNGNCGDLWSDIDTIIEEMEKLLNSFIQEDKPEWLTDKEFAERKQKVKSIKMANG